MENNIITKKSMDEVKAARLQIEEKRKEVRFVTESFQVKDLVEKFRSGKVIVPEWQRNFIWPDELKSKLIESLLLGLPIPVMFFAEIEDGEGKTTYEIVDGAQRTRTLDEFYDFEPKSDADGNNESRVGFELSMLGDLKLLNGFTYRDLPEKFKSKLDDTFMRVVILESDTTDDNKRELFHRINTNHKVILTAEKLQGTYPRSQKLLEKCIKETNFNTVCPLSDGKTLRLEESELALRFFAYLNNYNNFTHLVHEFLEDYRIKLERELKDADDESIVLNKYFNEFEKMVDFVETYFDYGFRKSKGAKSTPRVRFEAISVGVALALREKANLVPDKDDIRAWLGSEDFKMHTTTHSSNTKKRVTARIEFVKNKLLAGDISG